MELDLNVRETPLYGWQGRIGKPTLDALIEGIRRGHKLPPVEVIEVNLPSGLTVFKLSNSRVIGSGIKGGHHRARARYDTDTPLKAIVVGTDFEEGYDEMMHRLVSEIPVFNDEQAKMAYERKLANDPNYIRIDY